MKFKVREGFVVKITEMVDVGDGSKQAQEQTFFPSAKAIDLTEDQAREHAHKLEPVDAAATSFLTGLHVPDPKQSVAVDIDALVAAKLAEVLPGAVATALAAAKATEDASSAASGGAVKK